MKTPARNLFLAALASFLALTAAAWAQDQNPPASPPPPAAAKTDADATPAAAPADQAAPAPAATPEQTAAAPAPAAEPAAPAPTAPAAPAEPASELRRLDTPPASGPVPASPSTPAEPAVKAAEAAPAANAAEAAPATPAPAPRHHGRHRSGNARVAIWHDSTLAEGEEADAVVSVFGSSTSAGDVADAVVSIFGSSTASGNIGEAVVSVFGDTTLTSGSVGDSTVAVFGNNRINGTVHGQVVAVMGNVELGPKAEVFGEIVCVGGQVHKQPGAVTHGHQNNVQFGFNFGDFAWLHSWVRHCLILGRPLAFAPHLMWAWWIAIIALVVYVVVGLLFPRAVVKCAETFEQRPGYSILTAFLVALLTPAAAILLLITVVGTPALIIALFIAGLVGKAAMLGWIGRRLTLRFGDGPLAHPAFAVLIGGVIVLLLYTVPFVGFVVAKLLSWIGVGVAVFTLIQSTKRPKPARAAVPGTTPVAAMGVAAAGVTPLTGAAGESVVGGGSEPPLTSAPVVVSAVALPRAGFWIRVAAALIDAVVLAIALRFVPHFMRPGFLLMFAAYCAVFWALRGTTLGGIVCGLKVVRLDDRRVDWVTAAVRALAGFLSLIPAGLGFIWVAFDDQKQSWHDKIAGTTIVRVPRGVSLV
jgi:uncharacterized RDD family membrane protein YckC